MRKNNVKRFAALCLSVLMLCGVLTGCSSSGGGSAPDGKQDAPRGLTGSAEPRQPEDGPVSIGGGNASGPVDFAVRLFQSCIGEDENVLISPVSVLCALSMTANGAKGSTLAQMEKVFGMSVPELNSYLKAYMDALPEGEKYKLSIADSLWITDDSRFSADRGFLQANADYYGADICTLPFDDAAVKKINSWVEDKTDGMIKDILDEIPPDALMYLVNAVAFDAEWRDIYTENRICRGVFTAESGEKQDVEMMHSDEHYYLDDGDAVGFVKPYAGSGYAFAALLPKEGMSVREYAAALTGERLSALLANQQCTAVRATLPKFESRYSVEMSEILAAMGMKDAFDEDAADFSALGTSTEGNIFISRVLHKTFIAVDERGTKAGASTLVEAEDSAISQEEIKDVVLDRPFVYMIIDCEANLPLFMGIMTDAR